MAYTRCRILFARSFDCASSMRNTEKTAKEHGSEILELDRLSLAKPFASSLSSVIAHNINVH